MNRSPTRDPLESFLAASLILGAPAGEPPAGLRVLDLWCAAEHGAALFWADGSLDLWPVPTPAPDGILFVQYARRARAAWIAAGGAHWPAGSRETRDRIRLEPLEVLAVGGSEGARVTVGRASAEVGYLRIRVGNDLSRRPVGADGFFVIGVAPDGPLTSITGIDSHGFELGAVRL